MLKDYQALFHGLSEGFVVLDKEGYIIYVNPAVTSITGYPSKHFIGNPIRILYDEDATKADYELELVHKKGSMTSDGWRTRQDGSRYWSEISFSIIHDRNHEHVGYTCVLRDETEKKLELYELRKREERYRFMVESVKDYAIFMLDTKGNIISWNDGARRIKGYWPNEIIGKHFSTFYTAEDLESKKPERELEIAVATGKYEEEGWRVKKNGQVFWANVVITALFDEQNKHIGFSKVTRDLTEKKEAQEVLRQSEERYRSLVEQVADYGIFMMDEKGRIISWNEGARRINGYTAAEIIGKYFSIFYPEEDIINGKPSYELKVALQDGKYEEEGWRLRKDGNRFWASIVITPVYNNEGIHIGFSKVTRDLSERKEAERALRESSERYRTLAIELKQTNTALSYANEELEQFTSIVSHDLQEPIRTIKSFLQLIDMKIDAGQYNDLKTYISKSINAASRMRELIHNLLNYSQLSKGELTEQEIDARDLINEALQNLRSAIEASKARIITKIGVDKVHGDRVQLVQLLQNLIGNALKFTYREDPEVVISNFMDNGKVKFAVTDNGIGIEQNDLDKVFDIFRRLHTKKEFPGTGIGLSICKKIVDRHRGRIWPESQPGKGTTFYFTLNEEPKEQLISI
jgi:PAS domain S-box-containing protein